MDRFDENYRKACNRGTSWTKRFYFDHASGECKSFFYDGCVGNSQNLFSDEMICKNLCEMPSRRSWQALRGCLYILALPTEATIDAISEEVVREKEIYRCLEPLRSGNCSHYYPAYFYNKEVGRCEPFAYTVSWSCLTARSQIQLRDATEMETDSWRWVNARMYVIDSAGSKVRTVTINLMSG